MNNKAKKNSCYGSAIMFLIMALYVFIHVALGITVRSMDSWQMIGIGSLFLICSLIIFITGFKTAMANLTLSETLENKENRNKKAQNQRLEAIVKTPGESGNVNSTQPHP